MPVIIGEPQEKATTPYYQRKIQCPGHYLIPPTIDLYLREPVPELKDCSDWVEYKGKQKKINKMRIAKDRWGRKKIDWRKLIELKRKGTIIQPWITASYAIENVYDPQGIMCQLQCKRQCMEGKARIREKTIRRLNY